MKSKPAQWRAHPTAQRARPRRRARDGTAPCSIAARVRSRPARAHRLDRAAELLLVDCARLVLVPLAEEVDDARRRARERVVERELDVLLRVDLARAVRVECAEALLQLVVAPLARLARAHERAKLAQVELVVAVLVGRVELHDVLPLARVEVLLLVGRAHVVGGRLQRRLLLHRSEDLLREALGPLAHPAQPRRLAHDRLVERAVLLRVPLLGDGHHVKRQRAPQRVNHRHHLEPLLAGGAVAQRQLAVDKVVLHVDHDEGRDRLPREARPPVPPARRARREVAKLLLLRDGERDARAAALPHRQLE
eukprot:3466037-Prymnesium_polylepis.1